MRAGALSDGQPAAGRARAAPPSWVELARAWAALALAVLVSAAATALLAPGWLDGPTRSLPDRPLLMLDIFFNNLLLALLPLIGGWLAAGHLLAGRRRLAWLFVLLPAVVVARSVVTIGAVGGADPGWLADAARWWLLELGRPGGRRLDRALAGAQSPAARAPRPCRGPKGAGGGGGCARRRGGGGGSERMMVGGRGALVGLAWLLAWDC